MACLKTLKQNIDTIESVFPKTHERFQTSSKNLDELIFKFIDENGKKHLIYGNITEAYPTFPPLWFTDSEKPEVLEVVQSLNETSGSENYIINQVIKLIRELCRRHLLPEPSEIVQLESPTPSTSNANVDEVIPSPSVQADDPKEDDEDNDFEEQDDDIELEEIDVMKRKSDEFSLPNMDVQRIKRIKEASNVVGSIQANDRLMKELSIVYKSDYYKKGMLTVNLIDDCLYEWEVGIKEVDSDSELMKDLKLLKIVENKDSILLRMTFSANFPYEPPFVRVIHPVMMRGFVTHGGSLCLELLTRQGWSSAYSIESLIIQIISSLVKGNGRIRRFAMSDSPTVSSESVYTLANAQKSFQKVIQVHKTRGWHTPPKQDG
ncbi:GSCOCG00007465001-RA-CDS [Cotesia congregata]|uniref:Similar to UBE2Q2: Ubiquitin-conjugating enzyme E2 Q2 (Homo sapiens) n=1 Tax=Cotesia congregata TaxID=51543 RepID=A0A8J2GZG4_COTCN|nr:GSCOCG00007465001-RA-CDS [Cotesia congregata]CAG5073585.1 Similar to UBE2Q2: Ubiquitin-conjugating enzyme E2 Q2 (Homo sapiens) [Cotesia congregata]